MSKSRWIIGVAALLMIAVSAQLASATPLTQIFSPDPSFSIIVNFDTDPFGNNIADNTDIFNQYESVGVRFRDELSLFSTASGASPGDADNNERISHPNSLKTDHDDNVFALFENPVFAMGAFVMADHDAETISISAYDTGLNLVGTITRDADDEHFLYLGFTSTVPIAAVKFFNHDHDYHDGGSCGGDDDDELHIENLGATPTPEPATLLLLGSGLVGLGLTRRRKRA